MIQFRSRGRGKSRKVYPISEGSKTEYRRHYREKPSLGSSMNVHSDVKQIMKKDDSVEHGGRDYDVYKKRLNRDADSAYLKEYKKAERRDDKLVRKQEKEFAKNVKADEEKSEEEDEQARAVKEQIEGN